MGERSLNARGFFVSDLLSEARFGALAGFLGLGFVNVIGTNRHVGENGDTVAGDLHKAVTNGKKNGFPALLRDDFARDELRHQGHVLRQNAHLAFRAGKRDHVHVVGENFCLRRDDFQFKVAMLIVESLNC